MKRNKGIQLVFSAVILFTILSVSHIVLKLEFTPPQTITAKEGDYLVYLTTNPSEKSQLIFYSLTNEHKMPLLSNWDISGIAVSANGRLAFVSVQENARAIYILDYPFTNGEPVRITEDNSKDYSRMTWSKDGQYLAYVSTQDDKSSLSIWDGEHIFQIFDSFKQISELSWGPDNRLAFTEFALAANEKDSGEIFFWDGEKIVNLSQNPTGEDRFPEWNENGLLAFNSNQNGEHDILVWDGHSTKHGLPDVDTFSNIAPHVTHYYSAPLWSDSNTLTFAGSSPGDKHIQIYEWDGMKAHNLSQNPDFNNGGQRWRGDGYWSFSTYFSSEQLIYVRDTQNQPVLITEGWYPPAWSPSGYLIFCNQTETDTGRQWVLSLWDGAKVIEIEQSFKIEAFWSNSSSVLCSF